MVQSTANTWSLAQLANILPTYESVVTRILIYTFFLGTDSFEQTRNVKNELGFHHGCQVGLRRVRNFWTLWRDFAKYSSAMCLATEAN